MHKKICTVYGEVTVNDQTCQQWFAKFCDSDISLNDTTRLGRIAKIYNEQMKKLLGNNKFCTI